MTDEINLLNSSSSRFFDEVDRMVFGGANYMDAILSWCRGNSIEVEYIIPIIISNNVSVATLRRDAISLHFIKKEKRIAI